jgi:NADPH:quinone reductase
MAMVGGVGGLQGTLAEIVVANADLIAFKPKSLSMREAAALPLVTITAWEGIVDRAKVHGGQKVLVHAGAGGVGQIAVQLAKAFGAEVFATVSVDKQSVIEEFGATPIDYRTLSTEQYVALHTAGQGFDVVYDTVGGATIDASFVAVKRYTGHVVSCLGWSTHSLAPLSFRGATYSGVFTLMPLLTGFGQAHHGSILREAASLVDDGKLKPLLNKQRFSSADIDAAHALVESGALAKWWSISRKNCLNFPSMPSKACPSSGYLLETQRVRRTAGLTAVSPQEIRSRSATNHADAV